MSHIGWMLNVTKILPDLSKLSNHDYYGNYMDSLLFKPCFGEMKYNFPIKRFQKLSVCENTLKVYVPVTALISTNLSNILRYKKVRHEELHNLYMVPITNFTTHNHNSKVEVKFKKEIIHLLRMILFPPGYKSLEETSFSPFLRIKKSEKAFFSIPAMEAVINSRWPQAMTYLMLPLGMFFFAYPSLLTKEDLTSTEASQDKPLDTIWDAVLSMYYLNTNNLDDYSNYWPFKLLVFTANIVIVLVLLNMIIALMNDTFNKAKEDSNLGLMMYRTELIDDFERLEIPFINFKLYNSPYICYLQDPDLMKKWMEKSQKLRESKLYSWFDESVDNDNVSKENRTYYDKVNFTPWYELISGSKNQVPFTTLEDHETLWF
ncbi:hypothetical protein RirG_115410 [Rhizophagus irregularis DAOM 197198w]|uniref:Ion transport domain-containing protein n=2 Tax=Rhizophagus irregularis TaxID=588596 RepID=A0A015L4C1_RHIIW|nr:hypothetical protein RirG_115410 [Rhizophagus irregularis DAOM 197198w]